MRPLPHKYYYIHAQIVLHRYIANVSLSCPAVLHVLCIRVLILLLLHSFFQTRDKNRISCGPDMTIIVGSQENCYMIYAKIENYPSVFSLQLLFSIPRSASIDAHAASITSNRYRAVLMYTPECCPNGSGTSGMFIHVLSNRTAIDFFSKYSENE